MWIKLCGSRIKSGRSCMKLNDLREWTVLISQPFTSALPDRILFSYRNFSPITCSSTQDESHWLERSSTIIFFFVPFGPDSSKPTINPRRFCPQRPCPQSSDNQISIPSRRFLYLEVVMTHGGRRINHLRSNASFALYTLSRQQF